MAALSLPIYSTNSSSNLLVQNNHPFSSRTSQRHCSIVIWVQYLVFTLTWPVDLLSQQNPHQVQSALDGARLLENQQGNRFFLLLMSFSLFNVTLGNSGWAVHLSLLFHHKLNFHVLICIIRRSNLTEGTWWKCSLYLNPFDLPGLQAWPVVPAWFPVCAAGCRPPSHFWTTVFLQADTKNQKNNREPTANHQVLCRMFIWNDRTQESRTGARLSLSDFVVFGTTDVIMSAHMQEISASTWHSKLRGIISPRGWTRMEMITWTSWHPN